MKYKTKVKICGLTRLEDALSAAQAGADYAGFIFAPESRRLADPETVKGIVTELPPEISPVGVFVNSSPEDIINIIKNCDIRIVQLHGEESIETIKTLSYSEEVDEVWKTVHLQSWADVEASSGLDVNAVLADTMSVGQRGGTGVVGNWELAAALAGRIRTVLAGGLNPENIRAAVRTVRPFAVDTAGGVELKPGEKDHAKIHCFIENIRTASVD